MAGRSTETGGRLGARGGDGRAPARRPRVAVTLSPGRLEGLRERLEALGCEVLESPLVETRPRLDEATRGQAELALSLPWLLVTSRATVEAYVAMGLSLAGPRVGAVGPATAAAAAAAGGEVEVVGVPATAEGLSQAFLAHPEARGPVALPRGSRALTVLDERLAGANVAAMPVVVYDSVDLEWQGGQADVFVVASPSAARGLPAGFARGARLLALGETTARAVRERGWECGEAREPDAEAIARMVEELLT